ncbi:metal-dependent hydrolase [Catenulispora rubra]|uniref:metal-dependent hydrolase n=1 Tax=Catenulispora rubra TaxID=280293 RepID=UPI0018927220|nr:metal-dependent hydrolase [Catenulispora rubra]
MLGHSHATSGGLAWAAAASALPMSVLAYPAMHGSTAHIQAKDLLFGTFITAGAALLPDIDHPNGTIAHSVGPITHNLCKGVSKISGGHRHATHSLAFVAAVTYGTWAGEKYLGRYFTLGLVFFMLVLAVRALNLCPPGEKLEAYGPCILLAGGGTVLMDRWIASAPSWLPFAIGLGALTHLAGDCLTDHGCRLFWPFTLRTGIPLIQRTGNKMETWFLAPVMAVGCAVLLYIKTSAKP